MLSVNQTIEFGMCWNLITEASNSHVGIVQKFWGNITKQWDLMPYFRTRERECIYYVANRKCLKPFHSSQLNYLDSLYI